MKPIEILKKARRLVEDPKHWCKGTPFRNAEGLPTRDSLSAESFCMLGALMAATESSDSSDGVHGAFRALGNAIYGDLLGGTSGEIAGFKDRPTTTHRDVLDSLDKAIKSLE